MIVSISREQKQLGWTIKKTVRFPLSRPIATSGRIRAVMREGWSKQLFHCCAFSDQLFNNFAAPLGLFSVLCCQCCVGCRHGCVCVCVRADFGCDLPLRYVVDSFNLNKRLEVCNSKPFVNYTNLVGYLTNFSSNFFSWPTRRGLKIYWGLLFSRLP